MAEIVFPPSTAPSKHLTENGGRVINAYAEPAPEGARSRYVFRRVAGLLPTFETGNAFPRGALLVGTVLYVINGTSAYAITKAGEDYTVTELTGTVGGVGPVTMAHNMRSPIPQILIEHTDGMSEIDGGSVVDFSDPDLPASNSITFMDGYFFVSTADGRVFASDINDTNFNELNFTTAEAATDGLVRVVSFGRDLLMMGTTTTEFWGNAGNATGFPFSRGPVIPVGLLSKHAAAGFEPGFPAALVWVGSDCAVYRLDGYQHQRISTPHIERIVETADPASLFASVYVSAGRAFWVLSSDNWTLSFDMVTGQWHERRSYGQGGWRARFGVRAFDEWLTFDRIGGQAFRLSRSWRREADQPLVFELWSSQAHRFPGRIEVPHASFDFLTGVGRDTGIAPIETDPRVSISWSDDGGQTFGNALLRDLGTQGEQKRIDINRTGLTGRNGRQWKLQISDPVECVFIGAAMEVRERGR